MRFRRIYVSGLLCYAGLLLGGIAQAQVPEAIYLDPGKALTQYMQSTWGEAEGLPQNTVSALAQTPDGYLWIGTQEGLVRFNGYAFKLYDRSNTPALAQGDRVRTLFVDADGLLWVGTHGSGLLQYRDGHLAPAPFADAVGLRISSLQQTPEGGLWVGTFDAGLFRIEGEQITVYDETTGLLSNAVSAIDQDAEGGLWIGTREGLHHLTADALRSFTTADGLPSNFAEKVFLDTAGRLWISTDKGIQHWTPADGFHTPQIDGLPVEDRIQAFLIDRHNDLWIGTVEHGLYRLQGDHLAALTEADGLPHASVKALYNDREGSLWIGTDGGGLGRLYDGKFTVFTEKEGLGDDIVYSIYEDAQGTLWFGTEAAGLSRMNGPEAADRFTTLTTDDGLADNTVSSLVGAPDGTLWIGTYGGGLSHLKDGRLTSYTTADGLSHNNITGLFLGPDGTLWIGTDSGISQFRDGRFTNLTTADGLGSPFVTALLVEPGGAVWIGTYEAGLYHLHNGQLTQYTTADGLGNDMVLALHRDADGTLWIGTYGGGINRLKDGALAQITTADGLGHDKIFRILEDDQQRLWVSTSNKGIFSVSRADLNAFADGRADSVAAHIYTKVDGLRSNEMIGGVQPAGWKSRDGKIWFPSLEGVVMIDPGNIRINTIPPPVIIEKVVVDKATFGQPGTATTDTLAAGTEKVAFSYAGLSFINTDQIAYRYILEGYDQEWSDATTDRAATYTNLDPGAYTFRVVARNSDGVWNEAGTAYSFYLKPFFYQTAWFWVLMSITFLLLCFGAYRLRVNQLKERQRALERVVEERTHDLRTAKDKIEAQANKLEDLDRFKTQFFANISHEFRTPLTLMIGPLENALSGAFGTMSPPVQGQMQIMLRNAQRLLRLINQLLDLSKLESGKMQLRARPRNVVQLLDGIILSFTAFAEQKGIDLQFFNEQDEIQLFYEPDKLEKVFFNLLSNAVKFTPKDGSIHVKLAELPATAEAPEGLVEVQVRDSGLGIPADQLPHIFDRFRQVDGSHTRKHEGTGIGLALVKELVLLHGGTIEAESEPGHGTTFIVTLHKGQGHLQKDDIGSADDGEVPNAASQRAMVEMANSDLNGMDHEADPSQHEAIPQAPPDAPLVLIVDDNPDIRDYIRACLQSQFRVAEAPDGLAGVEQAKALQPDLILSDLMMPKLDGNGLCKAIKENKTLAHIPIILLTAKTSQETIIEALEHGADEFLSKPFNSRELLIRISNLLKMRVQEKELRVLNNHLEAKVQAQFQQMVNERHDYEQELIQAKERAEESAVLKTAILNNMSHEIRTPMAAILGYTQLLGMEIGDEHQEFVGYINQNGKRLLDTLNSILDLSRLESRNVAVERERINVADAAHAAASLFQPIALQKTIQLRTALAGPDVAATADRGALDRILNNLIGNALKFTDAGEVVVAVEQQDAWVVVSVHDTGIGISQEFLPDLFEAFKQESSGVQRSHEGSGLGLAITRHLVQLMGGDIYVKSTKGEGSTFTFTLPIVDAPYDDEAAQRLDKPAAPPQRLPNTPPAKPWRKPASDNPS